VSGVKCPTTSHDPLVQQRTQTRWDHGEFQVQLLPAGGTRPIGFCDGSDEDLAELRGIAEAEGCVGYLVRQTGN